MTEKPYKHCVAGCRFIQGGKCIYREMHIPTVAIDFDKTIFKHDKWVGHENYGDIIEGAKGAIDELRRMGFEIMIWTARNQKEIIIKALEEHDIYFDYINENPNQPPETNPSKPVADYYIDDRGVRFTNWEEVITEIKDREENDGYYKERENGN